MEAQSDDRWELIKRHVLAGHGVVGRRELLEAGVHPAFIRSRLRNGRLVDPFPGVYRLEGARLSERGRWRASVLQGGRNAFLSGRSALALHGLIVDRGPVNVTRTSGLPRPDSAIRTSKDGWRVRVGRTSSLEKHDLATVEGIPVVVVERALIESALQLKRHEIRSALTHGARTRVLDWGELLARLDRGWCRPGLADLRQAVELWTPELEQAASELEERAAWAILESGIPIPRINEPIGNWVVDLHWPRFRLVVELDGYRHHSDPGTFERDRAKDRDLRHRGLRVERFTWNDVVPAGANFIGAIRRLITEQESWSPNSPGDSGGSTVERP